MFYKTLQTSLSIGRNLSKKFERLSREERFYVLKRTKLTIISFTFKYTKVSYNLSSWCNNSRSPRKYSATLLSLLSSQFSCTLQSVISSQRRREFNTWRNNKIDFRLNIIEYWKLYPDDYYYDKRLSLI